MSLVREILRRRALVARLHRMTGVEVGSSGRVTGVEVGSSGRVNVGVVCKTKTVQTLAYWFFAVAQAALAVVAIRLYRRRPSVSALMLILPIAGVVWDNAIIALGSVIGDGPLLVALSWPRFIGHAILTPAWIVAAMGFAARAGFDSLQGPVGRIGQWVLYAIAVVFGLLRYGVYLQMSPVAEGGLFYYTNTGSFPGPPVGSILMLLVAIGCAAVVWRRTRSPWMLAGTLFMLATQVIPRELVGFLVTNSGEVVMAASLVATEAMLQHRAAAAPLERVPTQQPVLLPR